MKGVQTSVDGRDEVKKSFAMDVWIPLADVTPEAGKSRPGM